MKLINTTLTAALLSLAAAVINANEVETQSVCADPVAKVMRIMDCIQSENAFCAASGYANGFSKLHNRIDTETNKPGYFFWLGAFMFIDFELEFDHVTQVGDNQVSMRYVETVTFNDGETFTQHEHALVTVNSSCRMTLWDQYGDNKEQQDVDEKAANLFPF